MCSFRVGAWRVNAEPDIDVDTRRFEWNVKDIGLGEKNSSYRELLLDS